MITSVKTSYVFTLVTILAAGAALPVLAASLETSNTLGVHTGKVNNLRTDTRSNSVSKGKRAVHGNVGSSLRRNSDAAVRSGAQYRDIQMDNTNTSGASVRAGMNTGTNADLGTGTGMGTGTGIGAGMGVGTNTGVTGGGGSVGVGVGAGVGAGGGTH